MAINTLTGASLQAVMKWNAQKTVTGTDYNPISSPGSITKSQEYGTANANTALGGADELVSYLISLAASANTTVDLTSLTNVLAQSASFARLKGWVFRLLSTTDDATNGTNCTSVTIGNSGANAQLLTLGANTHTHALKKGGVWQYFDQQTTGFVVNATQKDILIVNNDGTNAAKVQFTAFGGST